MARDKSKAHGLRLSSLFSAGFGLAASLLFVAMLIGLLFTRTLLENKVGRQLEIYTGALGTHVGATFAAHARTVELVAQQPRVVAALVRDDRQLALQVERDLSAYFPLSLDVRLLQRGISEPNDDLRPRLGYADLAMIRASEAAVASPAVAVHMMGTEDQHVSMIHRVLDADGKTVVGHVMVLFDVSLLQKLLNTIGISSGYAVLQQVTQDGRLIQLAVLGDKRWQEPGGAYRFAIAGSSWSVAYWPEDPNRIFPVSYVINLGVLLGATLLLLAGIIIGVFLLWRKADREDMSTFVILIRGFRAGRLGDYQARLQDHAGGLATAKSTLEAELADVTGGRQVSVSETPADDNDTMNIEL